MSSFHPLNLVEDDKKEADAEHSRELQTEQAIQLYQQALDLHHRGDLQKAYDTYAAAFRIEIVSNHYFEEESLVRGLQNGGDNTANDDLQFLSQNVRRLRHLLFRNRGMLFLDILRHFVDQRAPELPNEADMPKRPHRGGKGKSRGDSGDRSVKEEGKESSVVSVASNDDDKDTNDNVVDVKEEVQKDKDTEANGATNGTTNDANDTREAEVKQEDTNGHVANKDDSMDVDKDDDVVEVKPDPEVKTEASGDANDVKADDVEAESVKPDSVVEPMEVDSSDDYVTADEQESPPPQDLEIYNAITKGDYGIIPQLCESPSKEETAEKFRQMFYTVIDDFCIALVYDEGDEDLLYTMYELYAYLREWRLARFALDYLLSGPTESDDVMGLIGEDPEAVAALTRLKNYLEKADINDANIKRIDAKYRYLDGMKSDLQESIAKTQKVVAKTWVYKPGGGCKVTDVAADVSDSFEGIDWTTLVDQFDAATRSALMDEQLVKEKRGKRDAVDLYWLSGTPVERVNLRVIAADDEPEIIEPVEVEPKDTAPAPQVEEPQPDVVEPTEVEEPLSEPMRASKRLARGGDSGTEAPNVPLQPEWFVESTEFFRKFSAVTSTETGVHVAEWVVNVDQSPAYVAGFLHALNKWTANLSTTLLNSDKSARTADRTKLLDVISGFASSKEQSTRQVPFLTTEGVNEVVVKINDKRMHYLDAKMTMVAYLLGQPAIEYKWSPKLYEIVEKWVIQLNSHLYEGASRLQLESMIGIYELLVNSFLERKPNQVDSSAAGRRLWVSTLELRDLTDRWEAKLEQTLDSSTDPEFYQRFAWARIHRYKCPNIYAPDNAFVLKSVVEDLQNATTRISVTYPNYPSIPSLSPEAVDAEATTLSVLAMFTKILAHDGGESVELLERILIKSSDDDDDQTIAAIRQFLERSSIDMTMSLWGILFGVYGDQGERLERGFAQFAAAVVAYLDDANARHDPRSVITVIGSLGTTLVQLFKYLLPRSWQLMTSASEEVARHTLRLFEWVYMFSIHEEASIYSSRVHSVETQSTKSFKALKDVLVNLATAVVVFAPQKVQIEMYSMLHDLLGSRRLCSAASGVFLAVGQQLLSGDPNSRFQVAQIIHCRYHYSVAIEGKAPKSHDTEIATSKVLDRGTCLELARVILPQCFARNSLIHPPKHEMRNIIDDFYQVLGKPEFEKSRALAKNQAMLDWFLDYTRLTPHVLKMAMYCQWQPLEFVTVEDNHSEVSHLGLYYCQAAAMFAQYKIKKKSMQSRIVDLETIIDLLRYDLVYNPTRFESWMLLGQAYGFLVEDDVIWTADKLNTPERKEVTANLQRKSLIAYFMAINLISHSPKMEQSAVIAQLTSGLAKELYSAVKVPMDGLAFKVLEKPRFINTFNKPPEFITESERMSAPPKMLLKIIQQLLQLAVQADDQEWEHYYYLAKVQKSLDKPTQLVLETIRQGSQLAHEDSQGGGDRIVEPHYQLVVTLYKYVKADKLSIEEAEKWLAQDEVVGQVITGIVDEPKPRRGGRRKVVREEKAEGKSEEKAEDKVEVQPEENAEDKSEEKVEDKREVTPEENDEDKSEEKPEDSNKGDVAKTKREATPEIIEIDSTDPTPTVSPQKIKDEANNDDDDIIEVDANHQRITPKSSTSPEKVTASPEKVTAVEKPTETVQNGETKNDGTATTSNDATVITTTTKDTAKQTFYRKIVQALKLLETYDKLNWHHRPKYRQAQVLFDELDDAVGALKPLGSLTSGKSLMNIWKPEFERGGKHFYYTYEYAMLYVRLLTATKDLQQLSVLFPRLKKSNATMINLYDAWDLVCQSFNAVLREAFGFELRDNSYTEAWLMKLSPTEIGPKSAKLIEKLLQDGIPKELEEVLLLLSHIFEMKKLNNGFGPTSVIDDTIAMLFLKCWEWFEPQAPKPESSEPPKRMAKKELYPVASELAKQLKPKIDEIKPNVDLTKWVKTQLPLRKAEREERERVEAERRARLEAEVKRREEEAEARMQMCEGARRQAEAEARLQAEAMAQAERDSQLVSLQASGFGQSRLQLNTGHPPQPMVAAAAPSKRPADDSDGSSEAKRICLDTPSPPATGGQ
ncbi:hypothetical protein DIURU_002068 [Diutina rugosa]|uniref:Histone transcription regulator 3 homolog n=1 Tax=Diutina rugosa TaxID=5481 RepID=A0A642US51_DIURU|nr:uncharacterized protein DIURU_002068 [Diutina rugosa]KAA8904116.1 hypothetical protein DIURU_002068 [Diutina rugosa]